MSPVTSREIHLKNRPSGMPSENDFETVVVTLPDPGPGQVLVRNHYLSVDPYMRSRMIERRSYTPPFKLGEPLTGGCVGEVIQSNNEALPVGTWVLGMKGWREYYLSSGRGLQPIDPSLAPVQAYLGVLGIPGLTAYVGLLEFGAPKAGETVFVSGAAGAVGSLVCQLARIKGCRVVGSAGSDEKTAWLLDKAGVDAAINYRTVESLPPALKDACPDGIDVFFDNVGGDHLESALGRMNDFGRIVACGMISQYNLDKPAAGPHNLNNIVTRRLRMQGFIVTDHMDQLPQFFGDMVPWLSQGKIYSEETIFDGLENMPQAFLGLFSGANLGKMLVRLV